VVWRKLGDNALSLAPRGKDSDERDQRDQETKARSRTMTLYAVILSAAKDLLAGYALSTLSLVGFEEILHYVQNDIHNIIANY
jgi:hypothetical protein